MIRMKLIFNFIMMFIAYNGFAQNEREEKTKKTVTFSNGDEEIKIIAKSDKNVIKLTTITDYHKYEMLDLSHHEAVHKSAARRKLTKADQDDSFMADGFEKESENENDESSGA